MKNSSSHERSSSLLEFPLPQSDLEDEDDESREEDFLEFVKETAGAMNVQKIFSDLAENESVIDPETGMLIGTGKLEFLLSKLYQGENGKCQTWFTLKNNKPLQGMAMTSSK